MLQPVRARVGVRHLQCGLGAQRDVQLLDLVVGGLERVLEHVHPAARGTAGA